MQRNSTEYLGDEITSFNNLFPPSSNDHKEGSSKFEKSIFFIFVEEHQRYPASEYKLKP